MHGFRNMMDTSINRIGNLSASFQYVYFFSHTCAHHATSTLACSCSKGLALSLAEAGMEYINVGKGETTLRPRLKWCPLKIQHLQQSRTSSCSQGQQLHSLSGSRVQRDPRGSHRALCAMSHQGGEKKTWSKSLGDLFTLFLSICRLWFILFFQDTPTIFMERDLMEGGLWCNDDKFSSKSFRGFFFSFYTTG